MRFFILILSFGLLAFHTKNNPLPSTASVTGSWKGSYGNTSVIHEFSITIHPGNHLLLNDDYNTTVSGSYQLIGDSLLVITCQMPAITGKTITLKGALNKTKTFIDGEWEINGTVEKGNFYLQKHTLAGK